jgi:hypothetical protein
MRGCFSSLVALTTSLTQTNMYTLQQNHLRHDCNCADHLLLTNTPCANRALSHKPSLQMESHDLCTTLAYGYHLSANRARVIESGFDMGGGGYMHEDVSFHRATREHASTCVRWYSTIHAHEFKSSNEKTSGIPKPSPSPPNPVPTCLTDRNPTWRPCTPTLWSSAPPSSPPTHWSTSRPWRRSRAPA